MPRIGGAPGLARRLTAALLVLVSVTDACPFAGKKWRKPASVTPR